MLDLRQSWKIGPVEIPSRVVLAPMAGVSVQAFRRQGRRFGAGLVCSEMVSCAGLQHRNERTLGYLRIAGDEHPLAVQIFGSEPRPMADAAVMVGRAAQGSPWALREIVEGDAPHPSRDEVVAELVLFIRETVRELGERRATGFLRKFYGWYLGRGRFPRAFKAELTQVETIAEAEARLFAAVPGARFPLARLEEESPPSDEVLLDLPISIY